MGPDEWAPLLHIFLFKHYFGEKTSWRLFKREKKRKQKKNGTLNRPRQEK